MIVALLTLCSRIRGVSQCPLLDAALTLLGLGKEFEANYLPASLTGQQHQGGLLKDTEVDPAAFCAFLMAFPLCVCAQAEGGCRGSTAAWPEL